MVRTRRLLAPLLGASLLLAACGGSDDAAEEKTATTKAAEMPATTAAAPTTTAAASASTKDIVDTAVAAGDFKTLAAALKAADLVDTLKGKGPFTVFAPTDAAFAALPAGTLDSLLKPENKAKLQEILKYHVVAGDVKAADVVKLTKADTVAGKPVTIKVDGSSVVLNDKVKVIKTDIKTSNGTIHVIDAVLIPS
jgi:transforming growth factor-beta-induced protein